MARKTVDIRYISNPVKRKATFKKRKNGLLKKVSEISTLCATEACAIVYSPDEPTKPEVWPSDQGVRSVISSFRRVSELDRKKKMLCQQSLLRKNLIKAQEQLKKLKAENRKKEMSLLMCQYFTVGNNLENSNSSDLNDNSFLTDKNMDEMRIKVDVRQAQDGVLTIENGAETMHLGEKALVNYQVQGPETNGDAMEI